MNNEETHDHEHNQGRSIIARQPYRPPPCEADDFALRADDQLEAAAEQHAGETHGGDAHGHAGDHGHADEHDAHAHDEHQQAAETEEHAHDEHRQGEDAALSSPDEHRRAGAQQFPSIECAVITVSDLPHGTHRQVRGDHPIYVAGGRSRGRRLSASKE